LAADILIDAAALNAQLSQPNLVILHVGTPKDYAEGHLPGARLVTLADLSVTGPNDLRLELPPAASLQAKLRELSVSNTSRTVIYAGNESTQSATRVWFTFDYLGLPAQFLNGGLTAWKAAGLPLSTDTPPAAKPGSLDIRPQPSVLVTLDWIQERLGKPELQLIDARTPEFYSGQSAGMMPRAGRIPGARNVPFPSLLGPDRRFLPVEELRAKLDPRAGATLVTYCHIGQQATMVYFAARLAGLEPKLYDGSYQEWSNRASLPIEPAK
jgi:thiosulfate/3-mercaptopyruvate sulfurtransferase